METPELYIRQDPTPNAYTLAIKGRKPFIVMHTSLVDTLSPAEVQVSARKRKECDNNKNSTLLTLTHTPARTRTASACRPALS